MKVQQADNDKTIVRELIPDDPDQFSRWWLKIQPGSGKDPASQEELEWIASKIVEALDGKDFDSWGCFCDLEEGEEPDTCVIDEDRREDCGFASGMEGRKHVDRKEECPWWRRV